MRNMTLALVALTLSGSALADIRIPNTRVSYSIRKDPVTRTNASMVFVDASNDASGKTYLAFACDNGEPFAHLYSKVTLGQVGDQPASYFSANGGSVRSLYGIVRDDLQSGRPTVLDLTAGSTAQLLRVFMSANTVSLRIERENYSALTLTFPAAGFSKAWQAIRNCD